MFGRYEYRFGTKMVDLVKKIFCLTFFCFVTKEHMRFNLLFEHEKEKKFSR